ncbi:hypothetical protein BH23PLA1_BH23PLA1_22810 [soil metagenome]
MSTNTIGIVIIGRNEGERLRRCLDSTVGRGEVVVYVDSGSTDGSVELARALGAEVVELDLSTPFTAARARNAGADRLLQIAPNVSFIQFVDGDCELVAGWLDRASNQLEAHPDWAVVSGRLREREPERSIYNRLADLEWDTPLGEAEACGGIAMIRTSAFQEVGGFDPKIAAGEEPELCLRMRQRGWKIWRIEAEMARHDIAMTRFGQWWRRTVRAGYAYAEGAARHGRTPQRHWVRESRSIAFWGIVLPLIALALAWPTKGASLALLLVGYALLYQRVQGHRLRHGNSPTEARLYASYCLLGKFPQALGLLRYWRDRLLGRWGGLIEYKGGSSSHAGATP